MVAINLARQQSADDGESIDRQRAILHIGMPKTGTTTIQDVFSKHPQCVYFGKGIREQLQNLSVSREIAGAIFFSNDENFQSSIYDLRKSIVDASGDKPVFLSDEAFTFVEFMQICEKWGIFAKSDHRKIARRLSTLLPDAKICVTLRNQKEFIESYYLQMVKMGSMHKTFPRFLQQLIDCSRYDSMLHALQYDKMLRVYQDQFGQPNVQFFFFEDYKNDFGRLVEEFSSIIAVDPRQSLSIWSGSHLNQRVLEAATSPGTRPADLLRRGAAALRRPRKAFSLEKARRRRHLLSQSVEWTNEHTAFIRNFFSRPNKNLAEIACRDIRKLGYHYE